jgi:hypothetical protein
MTHLQSIHKGSSIANGICVQSEKTLYDAMSSFKEFCHNIVADVGGKFHWEKRIFFSQSGTYISPDGGVFYITLDNIKYCFLIIEDKYQGTNDIRFCDNLSKQSTGNAIERVFKNVNASWHLFKNLPVSPYLVFVAGCDFHNSESIIHRIGPISNFGRETITWEMEIGGPPLDPTDMVKHINLIKDVKEPCHATFCVKAHKYDEFPHKSSMWTREERLYIMKHVAGESVKEIVRHHDKYGQLCTPTYDNIHR